MYVIRPSKKSRYSESRRICRKYMADYTGQTSAPTKVKGGFYGILIKDTGEVWLGETNNFSGLLTRVRSKQSIADCITSARARGSELEIYLLTRPELYSAQELENELWSSDLLAPRKTRNLQGPGQLYVIRHDRTHDYFVVSDRQGVQMSTLLNNFYGRLQSMGNSTRNVQLNNFVTDQANDILRGVGFTITPLEKFDNREDEWLKRQLYIDTCKFGNNLNWMSVE